MKRLRLLVYIIRHKYLFTFFLFFIWIFFFDKNNLISQIELAKKLHQLKNDKKYYLQQIKTDSIETIELMTNPVNLEKFARERYMMKRDSEDIYLIVHKEDSTSAKKE
jgi:transcription initiation factor IIF auxiliary subunit